MLHKVTFEYKKDNVNKTTKIVLGSVLIAAAIGLQTAAECLNINKQ